VVDCWNLAEQLWAHPAAVDWRSAELPVPDELLTPPLLAALRRAIPAGTVVPTVSEGRPNTVVEITPHGVYIETERSQAKGSAAQLVPAWMLQLAWDYLQQHRQLSNRFLLATDGLNVKRSSAVCALLAQLPDITTTTRPLTLHLQPS
jgi:hypothetical protein